MVLRSHGPIFGCVDHCVLPHEFYSSRTASERIAWDAQTGPVKLQWKPERSALAFRSNTVCIFAATESRAPSGRPVAPALRIQADARRATVGSHNVGSATHAPPARLLRGIVRPSSRACRRTDVRA